MIIRKISNQKEQKKIKGFQLNPVSKQNLSKFLNCNNMIVVNNCQIINQNVVIQ